MTLTLTDLETRVKSHIHDPDLDYISQAEIWAWINDAHRDLGTRLKIIRREATGTQSVNDATLTLPTDFLEPVALRLDTDDVEWVDDEVWWSWSDAGEDPGHTLARVFGSAVEFYPTPTQSLAYVFRYIALPTVMTAGGNTSELPDAWAVRSTYYAIAQAWAKRDDVGQYDRWLARYEDNLTPLDTGRDRFIGPTTLTVAAGPFDVDSGAWHI